MIEVVLVRLSQQQLVDVTQMRLSWQQLVDVVRVRQLTSVSLSVACTVTLAAASAIVRSTTFSESSDKSVLGPRTEASIGLGDDLSSSSSLSSVSGTNDRDSLCKQ